jgi:hypothetical protein
MVRDCVKEPHRATRDLGPAPQHLPCLLKKVLWLEPAAALPAGLWRRVLHTCHHRTQVRACLRLAGHEPVPAIYGPSGDVKWDTADPTNSVEAALGRSKPMDSEDEKQKQERRTWPAFLLSP